MFPTHPACKTFTLSLLLSMIMTLFCFANVHAEGESVAKAALSAMGTSSSGDTPLPDLFTGTMSYSIPISTPPGRKGMDPGIALTYRSTNGNGWVGTGWEFEVGSIQRSLKQGVDYGTNDYNLRLGGANAELVNVGGYDYLAKIESGFTKLTQMTAADNRPYWVATDKSGIKFIFGETAAARQDDTPSNNPDRIFKWCLNRVEDPNGNYMTITYFKDTPNGQIYLDKIDYTGNVNGSLQPTIYLKFYRDAPYSSPDMYTTNFKVNTRYLLKTIEVKANGNPVKAYKLSYRLGNSSQRPILTGFQEFGKDAIVDQTSGVITNESAASKMPALSFDKLVDTTGFNLSSNFSMTVDSMSGGYNLLGDFNGDGKTDVMNFFDLYHNPRITTTVYYSNGSSFEKGANPPINEATNTSFPLQVQYLAGDFDGDGKTDILFVSPDTTTRNVHYAKNGFSQTPVTNLTLKTGVSGAWNRIGDFDGDGKADILAILTGSRACINPSTGNGFSTAVCYDGMQLNAVAAGYNLVGDFDGDGKMDILSIHTATSGYIHYAKYLFSPIPVTGNFNTYGQGEWNRVGDFNGDGKADLLSIMTATTVYVNFSTGNGFTPVSYATLQINTSAGGWNLLGDFNGDGKTDLLSLFPTSNSGYIHYSTGSGFYKILTSSSRFNTHSEWLIAGDYRGTGKADLLIMDGVNSTSNCLYQSTATPDLIDSFANGLGGSITVGYKPSTQYVNTQLPFPVHTVGSISVNDSRNNILTNTYFNYSGGFFHIGERDFRGFNEVTAWGPVSTDGKQTVTTTYFHQGNDTSISNDPLASIGYTKGKPYRTKIWGASNAGDGNQRVTLDTSILFSETTTSYKPDTDNVAPFFTPPLQIDTYLYDTGAIAKHTKAVYAFDDYGNMTRMESYGDTSDPPTDRTIVKEYSYNTTNYIVGLPYRETIYEGIGIATPVAVTDYYYDDITSCTATPTDNQTPLKGNLTRIKRWLEGVNPEQWIAYDSYGNVICTRDPNSVKDTNGKYTSVTYDSSQTFPVATTNPLQQTITSKYYGIAGEAVDKGNYGQLKSVTDPNGAATGYEYDKLGRKTLATLPDGFWTGWDYANFPQKVRISDSALMWSDNYLDGFGRVWKEERKGAEGKTIVTDTLFDARGAIYQKSLPYFKNLETAKKVTYTYDALGRISNVLNPDTTTLRTCYTPGIQVDIDANSHRKRKTMDALGRLVKVEEYLNTYTSCTTEAATPYATTSYQYDIMGNLRFVTDTKGNQSEMRYDSLGRKFYMKDPDMGEWLYEYDASGNLTLQTDANLQRIKYQYDQLNRLKTKDFGADNSSEVTYIYDEVTTSNGIGRLTTMTDSSGITRYAYDAAGRGKQFNRTVGTTVYSISYVYDKGRLASITYPQNSETVLYGYDADSLTTVGSYVTFSDFTALGRPKKATYGNGVITSYTYHPTKYLLNSIITTSPTQGGLINLAYDFYDNGNIRSVTDNLNTAVPHIFAGESFSPHYSKPHAIGATGSGRSFIYDDNGNMTSDGKRSVTYNPENMPSIISSASNTVSFLYDGNGQRVKKTAGTFSRLYIDKLYECPSDSLCGRYIFAGDTLIAMKDAQAVRYYHVDHLGSTRAVTDGAGNKIEAIEYYPFGENRSDTGTTNVIHKYTSQEFDYEVGLYNYNARLYDPEIGRFVTADSIITDPTNPQNFNRYSYVQNDPLNLVDPTGNEATVNVYNNGNYTSSAGNNGTGDETNSFKEDWKPWAQRFERIGREIGRWGEDIGKFFSRLFGHKNSSPQPTPFDIIGNHAYGAVTAYNTVSDIGQNLVTSEPFIDFGESFGISEINSTLTGQDFRGNEFTGIERITRGIIGLAKMPTFPSSLDKRGLGNPFQGKSAEQLDKMFKAKGFEIRGPDAKNGLGGYVNPKTGRSYHIDESNSFNERPHVDVNRLKKYNGPLEKKKYFIGE